MSEEYTNGYYWRTTLTYCVCAIVFLIIWIYQVFQIKNKMNEGQQDMGPAVNTPIIAAIFALAAFHKILWLE